MMGPSFEETKKLELYYVIQIVFNSCLIKRVRSWSLEPELFLGLEAIWVEHAIALP